MGRISGLVPSRFLTLLAHLVVVITLFWSRDSNIQACLPLKFTPEEYEKQDMQLVAALSVTLALFAVELAGFFSGVSMFNSTQSLISIGAHCSASVALSFFIFERWECTTYWYIFVFCRLRPRRFTGHGIRAQPLRGMRDLPGPGHELSFPASTGGLSTTALPESPQIVLNKQKGMQGGVSW
ncbi:transmembrane protein 107 isoform X1 [Mesoplodon densirostris]|uniref:transmembrane protein 107 isoform X1 n=1 Tax=Mesoplodon densirostris TaxID=48708 RepID=UPI0028DBEB45|nr:transmembrane protein 107 isoform X1 [Mesoplodon densirostris]XP_059937155.1 transmembrane protein 107 isoform X1 [Mesoplodon densirostris]